MNGIDIPTFTMFRARLTNDTFEKILRDLRTFSMQYGPWDQHSNEEARSHFISGYFNQIVALFYGRLLNTPEAPLNGRIATKGRVEYQFKIFGGITVLFIEVKLQFGSL